MNEIDKVLFELQNKNKPNHLKNKIKYSDDIKLVKVAFDIYRIDNGQSMKDHYDGLWRLDGNDLVRASNPKFSHQDMNDWSVSSAYDNSNIVLAYKSIPIANFTSKDFGYSGDNISFFKQAVLDKVNNDNEFASDVLSVQEKAKLAALQQTFPELKKYTEDK